MPPDSPLSKLRELRAARQQLEALLEQRDGLIREAAGAGYSERQIAQAAGLTPGRINQIVHAE